MDNNKLCEKILEDPKIRFSMIIKDGKRVYAGYRGDVTEIIDSNELTKSIWSAFERWKTRQQLEHKLGKTKYALVEYDKVKRLTFPVDDTRLLLVSMDHDGDHNKVIDYVLSLIKFRKS